METTKNPINGNFKQKYKSSIGVSRYIAADIRPFLASVGLATESIEQVELCLVELINNVYEHAYNSLDGHPIEIASYLKDKNELVIEISDYGYAMTKTAFDDAINAEFVEPVLEDPKTWTTSGRGLIIIVQLADNLEYSRQGEKNTFKIYKKT